MGKVIDEAMVRQVSKLSRITLGEGELASYGGQLGAILSYFDKLSELKTEGIEPLVHAVELHNVLAEDVLAPSLSPAEALANAPARDGNLFSVPKVIGDS